MFIATGVSEHWNFPALVINYRKRMTINHEMFLGTRIFSGTTMKSRWQLAYDMLRTMDFEMGFGRWPQWEAWKTRRCLDACSCSNWGGIGAVTPRKHGYLFIKWEFKHQRMCECEWSIKEMRMSCGKPGKFPRINHRFGSLWGWFWLATR